MLVTSRRIYSAGKLAGYLTRLSATGLASVTSGGGQVPAFRISPDKFPIDKVVKAPRLVPLMHALRQRFLDVRKPLIRFICG